MTSQLIDGIKISLDLFNQSSTRIIWNLFLAFIPLILSFYLFRPSALRNFFWWIIFVVFIAFLPNAPYILTDSIHIIELSQQSYPNWSIISILIPQYFVFIVAGFEAYVISLTQLDNYLLNQISRSNLVLINAIAHSLCVVGIYLGRFERFNSWDLVTKPGAVLLRTLQDLFDVWKLVTLAIAWILIWFLSEFLKIVNKEIKLFDRVINH